MINPKRAKRHKAKRFAEIMAIIDVLKSTPGTHAHRCYDPKTGLFQWVPPEAEPTPPGWRQLAPGVKVTCH